MANIATLLARILSTRYGNEMRQDLHDAIEAVNDDTETALGKKLTFTNNTRKLKLLAKDDSVLSEVVIPGGGSGGGSVDSVNGLFPDENGNVELNLDDINDVNIISAADGQILKYNSTSGKWVNGTGGGGTSDYSQLTNKPSVNGVTLSGNKTSADLGISGAEDVSAIVNVYGSKNLNVYPYQETTETLNGVTFRDNGDGSITVSGATTSAYAVFSIRLDGVSPFKLKKGTYKLSGCPNKSGLSIVFQFNVNGETISAVDTGSGATFTLTADATTKWCYLYVDSNVDLTTAVTFYPMLRDARISDATFVPYALTNRELTSKTSGLSNRNLLDNPWFTVNQKGFTSGTAAQNSTPIDRWQVRFNATTLALISSGLNITNSTDNHGVVQLLDMPTDYNNVYTFSMKTSDGTIYTKTGKFQTDTSGQTQVISSPFPVYMGLWTIGGKLAPAIYLSGNSSTASLTITAMKLELGTESTLALDVAPNYTEELLKCQRYYVPLKSYFSYVYGHSATTQIIRYPLATPMRTTPTLYGSATIEGGYNGSYQTETVATSDITIYNLDNIISMSISTTKSYDLGSCCTIGWSNAYLSAEL